MLDCSEVSIEKDPTLKHIIAKYENEIKVHIKLEHELKAIVKQHEAKLKEKDDSIKELQENLDILKKEVRTLQKRNSELSLNLHDEIKQKLKIFKQLKKSTDCNSISFMPQFESGQRSNSNTKRKLSASALTSSKKSALKLSFDVGKSPKSLSRKGSIIESNQIGGFLTSTGEAKSPVANSGVINFLAGRRERRKKPSGIMLNFEDDLKKFFNGYFSSKQAFMTTNNSMNRSLCDNRKTKDRSAFERQVKRE